MIKNLQLGKILFFCFFTFITFNADSQEWTWMKGANTINVVGNYGTLGVPAGSNLPGAREAGATWTDNSGNLWLFGGNGYGATAVGGRLSDLWKWNPSTSQWTWIKGPNSINQLAVYGTKGTANGTNIPGARSNAVTWIDNSGLLWMFGGYGYDGAGNLNDLNDLWRYNISTNEWTWISGTNLTLQNGVYGTQGTGSVSNIPGSRRMSASWKDNSGFLWLFGGYGLSASGGTESGMNDLWKYDIAGNTWTWVKGSSAIDQTGIYGTQGTAGALNNPGTRYGHIAWKDNSGNLYLFGGYGYGSAALGFLNDVWKFNISTSQWTWLKGSDLISQSSVFGTATLFAFNNNPGGRYVSTSWTDNSGNVYIQGGYGNSTGGAQQLNDMWKYDVTLDQWTWVRGVYYEIAGNYGTLGTTATSNDPGSGNSRMSWKDNSGNFWLFGGSAYDVNSNFGISSELWKMNACLPAAPVNVSTSANLNICNGNITTLTAVSGTNLVTWYATPTGTTSIATGSVYTTPSLGTSTTSTSYTYYAAATNTCGISAVRAPIIATSYSVYPNITTGTTYTQSMFIGSIQTNNSDWTPAVYNFTDPLPLGAIITGIDLTYNGKDQGGGGTGAPANLFVSDIQVASTALFHTFNPYSTNFTGPITPYIYGGLNTFKFYFWGYPAWQGFLTNVNVVFRYQTKITTAITACQNSSLTLRAYGGVTYTWSNGPIDNVPYALTTTQIYTVTGANIYGCTNTATQQVIVTPAPTVAITGSSIICQGASVTQTASISGTSHTFSWSTGATSNTISLTPTVSTLYFATATNTITGCWHSLYKKITVGSNPVVSVSASSGTICSGKTTTLAVATNGSAFGLNFDGIDDYVETNISITELGKADFSIEAWIKTTGTSEAIITCGNSNTTWEAGEKAFYLDALGIPEFVGFNNNYIIGNTPVNDGLWHHVAVVWDYVSGTSGTGYIYIDGVNHTSSSSYAANVNNMGTFKIGLQNYNNYTPEAPNNFTGTMDDLRIWNTARTSSQISTNMNLCLTGSENGLVGYYNFEDGPGYSRLSDQSFYSNHGDLINMNTTTAWVPGNTNCINNFVSYLWLPGGLTTQSVSVTPGVTTAYTVNVTNTYSCSSTASKTISVNPSPLISANNGSICTGSSYTITPTGASTYTFLSGSTVVSPTVTSTYSVTGTSSLGCAATNTAVVSLTVNALPLVSINSGSLCSGNSFTITPTGANTYTFLNGASVVSPTTSASYSVIGTSSVGCLSSNTAVSNLTVNPTPSVSVNSGTICSGNSFSLVPSGASSYTFISGAAVVTPTASSSYSIVGSSTLGCISNIAIASLAVNLTPSVTINSGSICAGNSFTIIPSGAGTYTFLNGAAVVTPTSTSTYSVVGTSSLGCVSSNTAVSSLTVNALPLVSVNNGSLCSGNSFTLTPTGVSTFTFLSGASVVSPTTSSSYSVIGSSSVGCISSNTAVASLTVNPSPNISINNGTICAGNSFNLLPSGANTYTFLNGAAVVSPTSSSSYSVIGASSLGCLSTNTAIASLLVNPLPVISVNNGTICAGNSYTLVPSGANTYTYLNGINIVTPASSTSYSVMGTSVFGCLSANPGIANITVNSLPVLTISGPAAFCSGSTISETVTGANTYSWNTGSTSNIITINPTVTTIYFVTGTNTATGCFNTNSRVINIGYPPVINVNSGNVCAGNSFIMSPSGASTYTFSTGTNTVLSTVTPTANTSYFVSGTSSLGCVSTNSAISNVIVNASPVIIVNSGGVCAGKVFTMTPTGASTYTFSNGSSTVIPVGNSSYTVTGTNVLGCVSSVPGIASVTVNPVPTIVASNGTVCSGSNYSIVPTGASSYTYVSPSGPTSPWIAPIVNTNYSITGISAQGCTSSAPTIITVSVISLPTISVNSNTVCAGAIFTLTPTGASTYTYSSGASTVTPSGNNSYSVMGTSSLGCVSLNAAVANVTLVATPFITINNGVICAGKIFTMVPTGASTYTFSSLSATVTPLSNTSYTVTGTNSLGCVSSNMAISNVVVNPSPSLSIIGTSTLCNGEGTTLIATGALTYSWSNSISGSTQSVSPTANTAYTVSGSNANGCVNSTTILVVVNPLPVITLNTGTVCPSSTFAIIPTGGATYTFSSGSNIVAPAITTSYSVTGTGTNGCVSLVPAITTVTVVNTLSLAISGTTLLCVGDQATLSVIGANTYTWSNGTFSSTIIATPTVNSTYTVIGADGSCSDTAFISVKVNPIPSLLTTISSSLICAGESSTLTVSGANTYMWSGGETATVVVISPSVTTIYTITGVDANGCSNKTMLTQNVNDCLGIKTFSESFGLMIKLYPNPNNGEFIVEVPKRLKMTVLNSLGQTIVEKQLIEGKNSIILEDQAKGIYFIEFKSDEQIRTVRVVKQ